MSTCRDCGREVRFVKTGETAEGKPIWSLPMDSVERTVTQLAHSPGSTAFAPVGYEVTETFRPHDCEERRAAQAKRQQAVAIMRDVEKQNEERVAEALTKTCERCGAGVDQMCFNLNDVKNGRTPPRTTAYPHDVRMPPFVPPPGSIACGR